MTRLRLMIQFICPLSAILRILAFQFLIASIMAKL